MSRLTAARNSPPDTRKPAPARHLGQRGVGKPKRDWRDTGPQYITELHPAYNARLAEARRLQEEKDAEVAQAKAEQENHGK